MEGSFKLKRISFIGKCFIQAMLHDLHHFACILSTRDFPDIKMFCIEAINTICLNH
uniref:Uncharacterized protein n=1 Tax=Ciona intestinalis TaxID=7719 RepID=H2XL62_CIOIN